MTTEYIPGVCNIGTEEIRYRRNFGWFSVGLTVALLLLFVLTGISRWWRLVLFLPAMMSGYGFIQARSRFCAGFARRGVFNFGTFGNASEVTDDESRAKDRRKGREIAVYSSLIGAAAAILSVIV